MSEKFIDLTPRGCETAEGRKRVDNAEQAWIDAAFACANATRNFAQRFGYLVLSTEIDNIADRAELNEAKEDWEAIRVLTQVLDTRAYDFVRSLAGRD